MQLTRTAARPGALVHPRASATSSISATRIVVSMFGAVVAFAGVEHGVGELLQGPVTPPALVIESWPGVEAFAILAGEPAITVIPNLLVSGVLAVTVALAFGIWAVVFIERPHGGLVLGGLSVLLLLVGGGFGPPMIGIILGVTATRIGAASRRPPGTIGRALARVWPWVLAAGVLGYLGLVPGVVLLSWGFGLSDSNLVLGLSVVAFAALLVAPAAARAHDRLQVGRLTILPADR
jgi:hypothetical protein